MLQQTATTLQNVFELIYPADLVTTGKNSISEQLAKVNMTVYPLLEACVLPTTNTLLSN